MEELTLSSAGSIFVDLLLRDGQYIEGLKRSKNNTAKFGSEVNVVSKSVAAGFAQIAVAIASAASAGGLAVLTKNAIASASALKDTSERLQIGTADLQKYQFAAKLVGIEADTLETGLTKLNAKIADGTYKYDNTTEALISVAEAIKNAKNDTERLAIANDAFGAKMGSKFLPLLKDGADGLKILGDQAEATGNVINSQTIEAADNLGDRLDVLTSTIKNNFTQGFLDEFISQSSEASDIYKDPAFVESVQDLGTAFGYIAGLSFQGVQTLVESIKDLPKDWEFLKNLEYQGFDIKNPNKPLFAPKKQPVSTLPDASQLPDIPDYVPPVNAPKFKMSGDAQKEKKAAEDLQRLYEKNIQTITGLSKAQLDYNDTLKDLDILLKAGSITQDQYNAAVGRASEEFDKASAKGKLWVFDVEAATKRAAENIQDTLAEFLFDPADKGFKGMLLGFVDVLRRMAAEAASAQILKNLFGSDAAGGIFSKLLGGATGTGSSDPLGSALGGLFSGFFAEGGFIPPGQFGVAGERGAELVYGGNTGMSVIPQDGKKGGNTYYIDASGADSRSVEEIKKALITLAGPGVIEQRVKNAQRRGGL